MSQNTNAHHCEEKLYAYTIGKSIFIDADKVVILEGTLKWFKTKHIDLSDAELLIKLKEEPDTWTPILYSRYLELIYGVCLQYYKDPEKSKDATMALYGKFADKVVSHKVDKL